MASKKSVNAGSRRRPKRGQNFLHDAAAAKKIVDALGDVAEATVIEIGAGKGTLTELLSRRAKRLIGIEVDRTLAAQLRMEYARQANVEIIEADVLHVDLANLIHRRPGPLLNAPRNFAEDAAPARVIGNLPYYITSDILLHLFSFYEVIGTMVIMVQREVADRIAAAPGGRDYGLLSATCQLYANVEKLLTLPPGAFAPPPKVHSTVLRLTIAPRWQELGVSLKDFIDFLRLAFSQKRKTLTNNLKARYPQPQIWAALSRAKARPDARAESLPLEKMAIILHELKQSV
jgi:16S rRNA (adenine1518-N6/adenine1519-N6)-dimethyltransferase